MPTKKITAARLATVTCATLLMSAGGLGCFGGGHGKHTQAELNGITRQCGLALGELFQDESEKRLLFMIRHGATEEERACVLRWARERHLRLVTGDVTDDEALRRLAWDEARTVLAPFDELGITREQQVAADFRRLMAAGAMPLQNRPHLAVIADRFFRIVLGESVDGQTASRHHGEKRACKSQSDHDRLVLERLQAGTHRHWGPALHQEVSIGYQ